MIVFVLFQMCEGDNDQQINHRQPFLVFGTDWEQYIAFFRTKPVAKCNCFLNNSNLEVCFNLESSNFSHSIEKVPDASQSFYQVF